MRRVRPKRSAAYLIQYWGPQIAIVLVTLALAAWLIGNLFDNLAKRGIMVGFDFLNRAARFPIAESFLPYSPVDSFAWAFLVALCNTLALSALVIVASTIIGLMVALARRSAHPLANGIASVFVDATRNTPLVVQLLFWYGVVSFGLSPSTEAGNPLPGVYLTNRGLYLPRLSVDGQIGPFVALVLIGVISAVWLARRNRSEGQGRRTWLMLSATALGAAILWIVSGLSMAVEYPTLGRFNFMGGIILTPEFAAAVLGLVLYSSAFAGEIIRGGIDAVSRGQWEAGRAIGLSERNTLRHIVVPQALRIIVPPMTSQYVNVVKNSTLALVVGYPELNFVTATTINQTGQAVEGILILMLVFLTISGTASVLMNGFNRRIALVER